MTRTLAFMPLTVLLTTGVGLAQTPHTGAPAPVATATVAATSAAAPAAPVTVTPVPVAEHTSDAAEPQGFTYNPEGRRDPFVSLLRRGVDAAQTATRTAGLSGLGTAEISLRGTILSDGAFVGIVQGVDSKTYIVRAGDKLSDGSVRTITANTMVILQQVNDPLSLAKVHEVRKVLRQTEEGK